MAETLGGGNTVAAKRVDFTYNVLGQFTKLSRYADTSAMTHVASSHFSYDNLNRLTKLVHNTSTTPPSSDWAPPPPPSPATSSPTMQPAT